MKLAIAALTLLASAAPSRGTVEASAEASVSVIEDGPDPAVALVAAGAPREGGR